MMLQGTPIFVDTDTVESVADPDWKRVVSLSIYTIYRFGPHTYLQSTIFMTPSTNDEGYSLV